MTPHGQLIPKRKFSSRGGNAVRFGGIGRCGVLCSLWGSPIFQLPSRKGKKIKSALHNFLGPWKAERGRRASGWGGRGARWKAKPQATATCKALPGGRGAGPCGLHARVPLSTA